MEYTSKKETDSNKLNPDEIEATLSYLEYKKDEKLKNWFSSFSKERFNKNLQALKQYNKDIYLLIKDYNCLSSCELFCTQEGVANLFLHDQNSILYKNKNPIEFCKKQTGIFLENTKVKKISAEPETDLYGQLSIRYTNELITRQKKCLSNDISINEAKSIPFLIISGVGLGYHIAEIFERVEVANLLISEPNLDLFYFSLFSFDWANLLDYLSEQNINYRFVLGDKNKHIILYLRHFLAHNGRFLLSGMYIYEHYKSLETDKIINKLKDSCITLFNNNGFFDDSIFGLCHTCSNILERKNFVIDTKLPENYRDLPVFIIGSGPSLDENIPFIRKFQDKAIILACGSGIDALYHAGILPDFYVNIERDSVIQQTLQILPDKSFFKNIILLSCNICHPQTVKFFKNTALFAKENEYQLEQIAFRFKDFLSIKKISGANPLVGNMGLSSALHLGFQKLYLFGLDNGKSMKEKSMHSNYSAAFQKYGVAEINENYKTEFLDKGNFEEKVVTNGLFKECSFRMSEILKKFIDENNEIECINCSNGKHIDNTIPKHDYELNVFFEDLSPIDKAQFHNNFIKIMTKEFYLEPKEIKQVFDDKFFSYICTDICKTLSETFTSRIQLIKALERISDSLADLMLSGEKSFYGNCLNGSLQSMFSLILSTLYFHKNESKCLDEVENMTEVVKDFLQEIPEVFSKIPFYIMGEHRKFYPEGKIGRDMPHCNATIFPTEPTLMKKNYIDPQKIFIKRYK